MVCHPKYSLRNYFMTYKFSYILLLLLSIAACKTKSKCSDLSLRIFTKVLNESDYKNLWIEGKEAIPCLIKLIDVHEKFMVGMLDPRSSYIPPFMFQNYRGIDAAYLIELILSTDSLTLGNVVDLKETINSYKIYHYCVIVKTEQTKPILEPLNYQDIQAIEGIYLDWWGKNKNKSILVLRQEWKEHKRILDKSSYTWI